MNSLLLDERSTPSLRQVLGTTLARASQADFAVSRIRLAGIDLAADEMSRVQTCRVLVGKLDIDALADAGTRAATMSRNDLFLQLFDSGRLEVRAAGLQSWYPDFSILRGLAGGGAVTVLGAHYFGRPHPTMGPSLTCILTDPRTAASATARFDELWHQAYDVSQVVRQALHPR